VSCARAKRSTAACFVGEIGLSVPNPRREAFRILRRVEDAGAFASVLLEGGAARLKDPREVGLLTEIVLGVLRRRAPLDHAIAQAARRPLEGLDGEVLTAIRIGAYALLFLDRVPDFAAVDTAVSLVKEAGRAKAAGFANGVLRKLARERSALLPPPPAAGDVAALALFRSHPVWWTRRVVDLFGWDRADLLLAANNEPAATALAPWPAAGSSSTLAERLAADGVEVEPCRFVPDALRVVSGVPQRTEPFRAGAFWIQDEASQLAVSLFGAAVGPLVLDACAAPGGKTLALAARTREGGLVVAADRHARRLSRLTQNVRRLRAENIVTVACDMSKPAPMTRPFDEVLVDAPCSGTGTLRRHPEIRWRLTPDALPVLAKRQREILSGAADLVRPGGRLVYSVCSVEPEEGEDVIEAFLADRPEFTREDPRRSLEVGARSKVGDDFALRTSPLDDGMDGFFAALLTRRSE
jgi:16S rRNA (cytosine967-C5)-methyltransferase